MRVKRHSGSTLPSALADTLHAASLFSSIRFADLWSEQGGETVVWTLADAESIQAALVGVQFGFGPLKRLQIMPDGLYAGIWSMGSSDSDVSTAKQSLLDGISAYGYAKVLLADFDRTLSPPDSWSAIPCETTLVDISNPEWEPPDATIRSEIRKAEREGIHVTPFDISRHWDRYLTLVRGTESRHGRQQKYSNGFFCRLAQLAEIEPRIQWVVVEYNDVLAASHIYLLDQQRALYWQSYFDKKYSFLKANQYMLYEMARRFFAQGGRWLNLGSSTGGSERLSSFKEKWGGETVEYPLYTRANWLGRLL